MNNRTRTNTDSRADITGTSDHARRAAQESKELSKAIQEVTDLIDQHTLDSEAGPHTIILRVEICHENITNTTVTDVNQITHRLNNKLRCSPKSPEQWLSDEVRLKWNAITRKTTHGHVEVIITILGPHNINYSVKCCKSFQKSKPNDGEA